MNVSKEPIAIKANKDLFMLKPVIDLQCQATTSELSPEIKMVIEETELSQAHKKQFSILLSRYPNLFATKDIQLGSSDLITHKIHSGMKHQSKIRFI